MSDIEAPSVWVQYKGTSLCADFRCTCGKRGHIDDDFAYCVRCDNCEQIWVLPQTLKLVRIEDATEADGNLCGEDMAVDVAMGD
jgi:hypothetical protein